MKIITQANEVEMDRKEGPAFLKRLQDNNSIAKFKIERPITTRVDVHVNKWSRLFWFLFWLCFFFPMMIVIYFFCGIEKTTVFIPGRSLVELTNGDRMIIEGNEDYYLAFTKEEEAKEARRDFLSQGTSPGDDSVTAFLSKTEAKDPWGPK